MKINMKKIVMILLAIAILGYTVGFITLYFTGFNIKAIDKKDYKFDQTKTVSISSINDININTDFSEINLIPQSSDTVKAHLYGDVPANTKFEINTDGSTLTISENNKSNFWNDNNNNNYSGNLTLDVYLPVLYTKNISVNDSSGDLNLNGFNFNDLSCKLSFGKTTIKNVNANSFQYENSSGDLDANSLHTKTSKMTSSFGQIKALDFTGDLTSHNSSGDTEVQFQVFNNMVDINSSFGKVQLSLPQNAQFKLDAEASFGNINCDFPIKLDGSKTQNQLKGIVGNDKNNITIRDSSGDINVSSN